MPNNGGNITFGINFNVDKSGLNDLKKSLQDVQKMTTKDLVGNLSSDQAKKALEEAKRSAAEVEQALKKAYNPTLGTTNISKFNQELKNSGINLNQVYQNFSKIQGGTSVFRNMATEVLTANMQLKQANSLLDSMGKTMINTVKWGIASSVMNSFTGSIQKAYNYIKVLDSSLTDISIVTGASRDRMDDFARSANAAAQALGRQTKEYTNAALSFYQQGLSDEEVAARTETTLKASNITGADVASMADQLTAVWNGFQVAGQNTNEVVSKLAAVADSSASNMSELATAMSKSASVANNMGVNVDQLGAQIATIIATTRQAPQTVGNALKTIYARINDIKAGTDQAEVSLGNYTGKMAQLGVNVLDQNGQLRDTGQVMEEIGQRWGSMTKEQQVYLAQTMAGQRQMNNLIALFDNWDMYTKELNISLEAQGTLDQKNARYMESLAAHTKEFEAAQQGLIQAFANGDSFKGFIDLGTQALNLLTKMVDTIGGGGTAILGLGSILTKVFSKQISSEISSVVLNMQALKENASALAAQKEITDLFKNVKLNDKLTQEFIDLKQHALDLGDTVTAQQHNMLNSLLRERNQLQNQSQAWENAKEEAEKFYQQQKGQKIGDLSKSDQNFNKVLNNLKNIQKQAKAIAIDANNFSASILTDGFVEDIDTEMQHYITTTRQLIDNNKISKESQDILTESLAHYKRVLQEAKKSGLTGQDLLNAPAVKEAASELVSNLANVQTEIQQGATRAAETVKRASQGVSQKFKKDIDTNSSNIKKFLKDIDTKGAIKGFLGIASSIGQITFAVKSFSNVSKTFKDDTIPMGQKLLQLTTNLSMSLPMLKSGVIGVLEHVKELGVAFNVAGASSSSLLASVGATMVAFGPYIIAAGAVAAGIYAIVKAYNKEADAAKKANKNLTEKQQQYKELKTSYDELKDAIEDYHAQEQALEKLTEGTKAWNQQVEQLNDNVLSLIEKYPELADKVRVVDGVYEFIDGSLEELEKTQKDLLLVAQQSEINAQIAANQANAEVDIVNFGRQHRYERQYNNEDTAGPMYVQEDISKDIIYALAEAYNKNNTIFASEDNIRKALEDIANTNANLTWVKDQEDLVRVLKSNETSIIRLIDSLNANTKVNDILSQSITSSALESFNNEDYNESEYKDLISKIMADQRSTLIQEQSKALSKQRTYELSDRFIKSNNAIESGSMNAFTGKGQYRTTEGDQIKLTREDIIDYLAAEAVAEEVAKKLNETIDNVENSVDIANDISDKAGDILAEYALNQENIDLSKYTIEEINAFKEALSKGELNLAAKGLGLEAGDDLINALNSIIEQHFKDLPQLISNQISEAFVTAQADLASFSEYKETLLSKGELKDDDLSEYLGLLESIASKYPELRGEIEFLKQTEMSETEAYKYALEDIQDALQQVKREAAQAAEEDLVNKLTEDINDSIDQNGFKAEVDVEAKIDEFQRQIDEIQSADYQTLISVKADLDSDFDRVVNQMDAISDAASKIGQNFIVAGDDLRELNNAFPGILDGIQYLADGTAQLSQEAVENATNAAAQQVGIETEKVAQKINVQKQEFLAKAAAAQRISQIAGQLAQDETLTEQQKAQMIGQIDQQLGTLQADLSSQTVDARAKNEDQFVNAQDINSRQAADNAASMYDSALANSAEYAEGAIPQIQAVNANLGGASTGAPGKSGTIVSHYSGQGGSGSSSMSLTKSITGGQGINADTTAEQWEAISEKYAALAQSYLDAANDMDGQLAELASGVTDIADRVGNAAAGRGGTNSKSGGGGGGGGGGGKDKTKSAEEIDKLKLKDQDIDKYHQIERAIKRIDDYLDAMSGYEEKAIRGAKSDTIDKEVDALEQQKALYEQKIQMMQADLQLQQADLQLLGVQFDEQGNIINYTALMSAYQAQYNALLEQAKLLTGDAQESKLTQAESVKERLETLKSQMGAYEALQDKIMDAGSAIRDIIDKEEELRIKQFKIKIDTELEFADAKRDWNEFKKQVIDKIKDDDFLGQARARVQDFFSYYDDQGNGIIQQLTEHVNRTREEAEIIENGGTSSIYGKNEAQALEDLKHYTDELMQNLKDVQEIAKDIHDLYLDTIDKAQDAFDEQLDQYDQIDSIIEHDMNLLQLLSPENNEEQLVHYYDQRAKNHNQEIDFYRKEADMWKAQMENAEQGTEEWKKFRDNWESAISDMNSAVESAVENLIAKYENAISKIVKETKNQIMGGDWQAAIDEWDKAKWNDDRYLDIGSRATGVLDFMDKVNEAMNGQSPKVQKQLNDFLKKQVDYLNQIPNLRQIDLDIAYKKLEVLQKQMALEDAQEAKTRMRLRRDSQGNYTYQYVADEDQIATKQQQLRDTLEELRQLAKVDITETIDEVQSKVQEFFERAQELTQTYYDDQELLQEKLLELQEAYFGEEGYITMLGMDYHNMQGQLLDATGAQFSNLLSEQGEKLKEFLGLTKTDTDDTQAAIWQSILEFINPDGGKLPTLLEAFTTDVFRKNLAAMSEAHQNLLFGSETGLYPSWNTAIGSMAANYVSLTRDVVIPCTQAMINANAVYANDLLKLQQVAGVTFNDIAAGLDANITYTQGLIQANDYLVNTYNNQMNAIAGVCAQIANLCGQYAAAEQAAINAANAAIKFWFAANGQTIGDYYTAAGVGTAVAPASAPTVSAPAASSGGSSTGTKSGNSSSEPPFSVPVSRQATFAEQQLARYLGNSQSQGGAGYTSEQIAKQLRNTADDLERHSVHGQDNFRTWQSNSFRSLAKSFATGGYTGEWSDSEGGKLAFLHQKELVLNADDTINMLNAVKIASGIMERIAGLNNSVLDNLVSNRGLSNIDTSNAVDSSSHQIINIQADFPNVNSADEIKQAFNNLINIASQRASGNRRTY